MSQENGNITDIHESATSHYDVRAKADFADVTSTLRDGEVDVIFSRDRDVLEVAVEEGITYFSTVPSSRAALEAIETEDEPLDVLALSERPTERREWGQ
jgi:carbamoyl-phosphate synthase large subunit